MIQRIQLSSFKLEMSCGNPWWGLLPILLSLPSWPVSAQPGSYLSRTGPSYFPDYTLLNSKPYPFDVTRPLEQRARSYLDANCSQCHQPGGISNGGMDLRYSTPLNRTALFGPSSRLSPDGRKLYHIQPGYVQNSEVYLRLASVGSYAMPPMGRTQVDEKALALMRDWIQSLSRDSRPHVPVASERKSPHLLSLRKQELEIDRTGLDSTLKLEIRIFDSMGGLLPGPSITVNENSRRPYWVLRWAQPIPLGRYWMKMRWGTEISTRILLVL